MSAVVTEELFCKTKNCKKPVYHNGFCRGCNSINLRKVRNQVVCLVEDCRNKRFSGSKFCKKHKDVRNRQGLAEICNAPGCEEPAIFKSRCSKHIPKILKTIIEPEAPKKVAKVNKPQTIPMFEGTKEAA